MGLGVWVRLCAGRQFVDNKFGRENISWPCLFWALHLLILFATSCATSAVISRLNGIVVLSDV